MDNHKSDIEFKTKNQSKRESYHKCKNKDKLDQETV